jgi:hypothetical protein
MRSPDGLEEGAGTAGVTASSHGIGEIASAKFYAYFP